MNPRRHPSLHEAITLLKQRGATNIQWHINGHIHLRALYHGRLIKLSMGLTPSCPFAHINNLATLKRKLRAADADAPAGAA
jgi:hypothetical protein